MDNRAATLRALERFDKWSHSMKIALTKGDQKEIEELLVHAHQAHKEWKTTRS
jgi:prephenate dehydrogenase